VSQHNGWIRRTKIVATLGPNADKPGVLTKMIEAGVNVVRLNMSHGAYPEHADRAKRARAAAEKLGRPLAVLLDLSGPKLRTGDIEEGEPPVLKAGASVLVCGGPGLVTASRIPISIPVVLKGLRTGDRVLLDDGRIELAAENAAKDGWNCRVRVGGKLKSHAGLNLPDSPLPIPSVTPKDLRDLAFGLRLGVEYVALSFVRQPKDLTGLRARIGKRANAPLLIAKIEKPEALGRLDGIVEAADGVMVARGDLGVECPPAEVPPAQKRILLAATDRGRLSITATQMLESMVAAPRPTRAEASDVANAVYDGTDAVMMSEETAVGAYPVESVRAMATIAARAEQSPYVRPVLPPTGGAELQLKAVLTAAVAAAQQVNARAIAIFTRSGRTAIYASKLRPSVPILAVTPEVATIRRLALAYGVTPIFAKFAPKPEALLARGEAALLRSGHVRRGDELVLVFGRALARGTEHSMKVHRL